MNRTWLAVATAIVVVPLSAPALKPASGIDVFKPGWSHAPKWYARATWPCTPPYVEPSNVPTGVLVRSLLSLKSIDAFEASAISPVLRILLREPSLASSMVASFSADRVDDVVNDLPSTNLPALTTVGPV